MSKQGYAALFEAIRQKCQREYWYGPDMQDPDWWEKYDREGRIKNFYPPVRNKPLHPQRQRFAYAPATEAQLRATETHLGFPLPPLLRALYTQVANGGFGPAYGIIGAQDGFPGSGGGTLESFYPHGPWPCRIITLSACSIDLEWSSWSEQPHFVVPDDAWPDRLLMMCEYGCCIYFYVDASTEQVFESYVNQAGQTVLTSVAPSLEEWLTRWTRDERITSR